jgi:hypothetical protein
LKKLTKKQWKELGVSNPHNLLAASGNRVMLYYRPQMTGRAYQCAAWQVIHLDEKSNPDAHWRDHGHKTFNVFDPGVKGEKAKYLEEAKAFAKKKYGIKEWERCPWGDWLPEGSMAAATENLKENS